MKNKRRSLLLCFVLMSAIHSYSQAQNGAEAENITKVTFLNPGVSLENKIGKFQTLYAQVFMNTSASYRSGTYGAETTFYFDPALTLQYRYYYNSVKRQNKGLRTELNNMNYISPMIETIFSKMPVNINDKAADSRRAINRIGVVWGLQRNYTGRFSLDLNVGPGYLFSKNTYFNSSQQKVNINQSNPTILGQLNLGFWLNKKKNDQ